MSIGYARASRIIEMMAAAGILGEYKGSQAREVMMTLKEYEALREKMEAQASQAQYDESEEDESSDDDKISNPVSEGQRGYVAVEDE